MSLKLGSPVVPFCPFYFRALLLKPNSRKKGTLSIKRLLRNQVKEPPVLAKYILTKVREPEPSFLFFSHPQEFPTPSRERALGPARVWDLGFRV